jgi:SAM-dependent methyltransferase
MQLSEVLLGMQWLDDATSKLKSIAAWSFGGESERFESRQELERFLRRNWYHDFSPLGVPTNQIRKPDVYRPNQAAKQDIVFAMIEEAIQICKDRRSEGPVSAVELFCADCFYANYAIAHGVDSIYCVDLDADSVEQRGGILEQARLITRLLGNSEQVTIRKASVFDVEGSFDLCICAGGLYHLTNPRDLLEQIKTHTSSALVIQTVVSLENTDRDYFESPAPGWTWGSRFSFDYLQSMVRESGWDIVRSEHNELTGNSKPRDRGSAYLLCTRTE